MTASPVLELVGIEKRFGSAQALGGADFVLAPGEIHGLLGENGAGKSTLMHIALGLLQPDKGTIRVRGAERVVTSPRVAASLGIGMVHQHFTSIGALRVEENLWLAAGGIDASAGRPPRQAQATAIDRLRARLWEGLSPTVLVNDLGVGAKQRLELLQALATGATVLLLDEPTAVLAPAETATLLELLRDFAAAGGSAVFISHKLGEVLAATDRVTVLRRGRVTWTGPTVGRTAAELARAMVGSDLVPDAIAARASGAGPIRVRAGELTVAAGEVVGIAAVEGNGQRELLRSIAGIGPRSASVRVEGNVAYLPEDRTTEGLIPSMTLAENLVLGQSSDPRWRRGPFLDWKAALRRTEEVIGEFGIRTSGAAAPARSMSGGNQQKLVMARALEATPAVLVAENPTRGLDVRATSEMHDRLRALARQGVAVLVYSTDLDEVLELADRVAVMYRGRVTMVSPSVDRAEIGALMVGIAGADAPR